MNLINLKKSAYKDSNTITHRHILSVINTLIENELIFQDKKCISILDAGCGEGGLILFLQKYLPLFNKNIEFLICGYDLKDHGVQRPDFELNSTRRLTEQRPDINWNERIKFIHAEDPWPFENNTFDVVVSNQVLEHVWNHHQFFNQQFRVLKEKGYAVHVFPVREVFFDGHVFLPWVHKLKSWDATYKRVKFLSRLGLGKYKKEKAKYNNDIDFFSRVWADKLYHYCNYKTFREFAKFAKDNHLCITSRFTYSFYRRKFYEVFGKKVGFKYRYKPSSGILFFFLKRISGICFVMYKGEYSTYNAAHEFSTNDY